MPVRGLLSMMFISTFKATWDHTQPMPDLRLLIMEPSPLAYTTLAQLTQHGWGLCHVPMLDFLKKNTGETDINTGRTISTFYFRHRVF